MIITLVSSFFVTWLLLPVIYLLLSKKWKPNPNIDKEIEIQEVKTQNWVAYFIARPLLSIVFV